MPEQTVFTHNSSLYASRVYAEGILAAIVAVVSVERLINGGAWSTLWLIPLVVGTYAALRLLLTGSVPRTIEITEDKLVFSDARKSRAYAVADLAEFRVREFRASDTVYLRLQQKGGREQKYWIEWKAYSDSDDLVAGIRAIDMRLHPDSLQVRAGLPGYTPAEGTRHA
ncbi:MAG: hypothetical protein QM779_13170 [Propionicimonas sp.]|uniref:hypothetical protein n=1 Tax=Propionicimonas sp. TaxID=1955623 RepID=UPI003D10D944